MDWLIKLASKVGGSVFAIAFIIFFAFIFWIMGIAKYNGGKKNPTSINSVEVCEKAMADIKKKYKEKK